MNVYGKAALDVSTVKRWISNVNGNPRKKEKEILALMICPAV